MPLLARLSVLCGLGWSLSGAASAAPIRVAVIGAQMVHSDKLQRSQEWPAMLQKLVGGGYDVENFGDCCASVSLDYPKQPETHPYLRPPNNAAFKPGFNESVAFMPDIVIIGPWGKHDRELTDQVFGGKLDPVKFAADYETMIMTYQALPSHPKLFASLPIPIPFGMASGVVNDVILPATKMVLAKHPEIPVIDLWAPFVGHRELYNQDTGARSGTHVTPDAGLHLIANTVFGVWQQVMGGGGDASVSTPADAGAPEPDALAQDAAAGGTGGSGGTPGSAGTGGSAGGSSGAGAGGESGEAGASGGTTGDKPASHASSGCAYGGASSGSALGLLALMLATLRRRRKSTPTN
jgi:MYXO-CTERM domain-containing protein